MGAAGRTGLRYEGCQVIADVHGARLGIDDMSEAWGQMQIIEAATLQADEEHRAREREERESKSGRKGVGIGAAH